MSNTCTDNLAEVLMATMDSCKADGQGSLQTQKAATPLQQAPAVSKTTLGAQLPSLHFPHPEGFPRQLEIHSSLAAVVVQTCQADGTIPSSQKIFSTEIYSLKIHFCISPC